MIIDYTLISLSEPSLKKKVICSCIVIVLVVDYVLVQLGCVYTQLLDLLLELGLVRDGWKTWDYAEYDWNPVENAEFMVSYLVYGPSRCRVHIQYQLQ